ncbi:recombinase family protein [Ulvibacter litoralis]|uniref:Site-specific DNA recombinase n=1 Tax=Ulvibacter litoralis TaxID=227084 RepID=A0A1G7HG75_9FLAO|nr:recombinase family protein [Ulvibacter litoralis]GHC57683.1 resolvase [Ulvibacter litoralis]SDE99313.1 Site-specific DNA recombinase [Ulvibacter litoralis]
MKKARYIRISSASQNIKRQLLANHLDEILYIDICSGSIPFHKRDKARELLEDVKKNKINYIYVDAIDRLGRNVLDILTTLDKMEKSRCIVKVENIGIESLIKDKPNSAFKMICSVLSNVAEMERDTLLERQRQGILIAKAEGRYKGRVTGSTEDDKTVLNRYKKVVKHLNEGISQRKTAKLNDISLPTVQKVAKLIRAS